MNAHLNLFDMTNDIFSTVVFLIQALSSRVLVAAYWLFVVLMLATFTANLAAFLTVERMQERGHLMLS